MSERARLRAKRRSLAFELHPLQIIIPERCPALGIRLCRYGRRTAYSPSLDRLVPQKGYVPSNVRVVSDRANRLKGDRNIHELRRLARCGRVGLRRQYGRIADYLERETGK